MYFKSGIRPVNCNINSTINIQYLFAWIGLIKALKLIVDEQLRHAFFFFCRLVREITGKMASAGVNMRYTASAIAALQHAAENFLVDLFEHSNILAIHAK